MKTTNEKTKKYLEKMANSGNVYTFVITPDRRLCIESGIAIETLDFTVVLNGHFLWRKGFNVGGNLTVPDGGLQLAICDGERFMAAWDDQNVEYASPKRPLTPDFSLLISACVNNVRVILAADGTFSVHPLLLLLTETPSNQEFARALLQKICGIDVSNEEGVQDDEED